jgi:S-adenosylmethionine hydrolase
MTTDFGLQDGYVGALKAAILGAVPGLTMVDNTHLVPPGDVATGAFLLEYALRSFPAGAVHLGVVDPGVGSGRRMLALELGDAFVVGPENGLLDRARRGLAARAVALSRGGAAAPTFESRDVMAPAAARLAGGAALEDLGEPFPLDALAPASTLGAGPTRVAVAHVDHFGTLVLDVLAPPDWPAGIALTVGGHPTLPGRTFSDAPPGGLVAYRGSIGYLEVAARDGRADALLEVETGQVVIVDVAG